MQTTTLRVRVLTPQGFPAENANVTARLSGVGISQASGYIDRSYLSIYADQDGIAELVLWPNSKGLTDAQYRITARGSDGSKLIDELVTIPESETHVWLHDIVMVPPPTPKPYDEASIDAIQQARIDSSSYAASAINARDTSQAHSIEAAASIAIAQALRVEVNGRAIDAIEAAADAIDAKEAAQQAGLSANKSERYSHDSAQAAQQSADAAQSAAQDAIDLFGDLSAVAQAVSDAQDSSTAAEQSKNTALQHSIDAAGSASTALQQAGKAQSRAESAEYNAGLALTAAAAAGQHKDESSASASAAAVSASKANNSKQEAASSALAAAQAATTSLDRSAGLIAHAENLRSEINNSRTATQNARDSTEALFGNAVAIDEAVQISYANRAIVDVAISNNLIILSKVKP